jgi:hypothetical protein
MPRNLMDLLEEEIAVTVGEKARVVIAVMVVVMEEVAVRDLSSGGTFGDSKSFGKSSCLYFS